MAPANERYELLFVVKHFARLRTVRLVKGVAADEAFFVVCSKETCPGRWRLQKRMALAVGIGAKKNAQQERWRKANGTM